MLTPDQLAARRSGIGGSDAPVIAGVDPYRQPLELYHQKRGELPEPDLSDNQAVHFGNALEPLIAEEWAKQTGEKVRRDNRTLQHPDHDFILGHIDRRVVGKPEGLEVKNRGARMASRYGAEGTGEVWECDLVQCAHYLAVTGFERWHLAVYFGGGDFRCYTIERDEQLITDLVDLEHEFWRRVETGDPPPLDCDHPRAGALLAELYPGTNGERLELPGRALNWHQVAQEAAEHRKHYEAVEKGAKAHLRDLMGEAAVGLLPGGTGAYTRKVVKRRGYTIEATEAVDFRFTTKMEKFADA